MHRCGRQGLAGGRPRSSSSYRRQHELILGGRHLRRRRLWSMARYRCRGPARDVLTAVPHAGDRGMWISWDFHPLRLRTLAIRPSVGNPRLEIITNLVHSGTFFVSCPRLVWMDWTHFTHSTYHFLNEKFLQSYFPQTYTSSIPFCWQICDLCDIQSLSFHCLIFER